MSTWWNSLTPPQRSAYLKKHPNSKFAKKKRDRRGYTPGKQSKNFNEADWAIVNGRWTKIR